MFMISKWFTTWPVMLSTSINKFIDISTKFTYNHFISLNPLTQVSRCTEWTSH